MRKLFALILSLMILGILTGCDSSDYKEAVSLYDSGKYEEAAGMFEVLGDYEDSAEKVKACNYQIALKLTNAGKYEEALEMFESLSDYEDSAEMVKACNYQIALELTNAGKYQEALSVFVSLGDYKDCAEQRVICTCKVAEVYAEDGKLTEAVTLLTDYYANPKAQEMFFVFFAKEVTDAYLVNFQAALDSWNEYVLIWFKAVKASGDKTPVGGTVDIPKVDQSAPQVIALQRSMEKANKSVAKLREAYSEDVLQICDEDTQTLINTFFTSADTIDQQFQELDIWAVSLLFFGIRDNNAAKANNELMNALYNVQDVVDVLVEKYN